MPYSKFQTIGGIANKARRRRRMDIAIRVSAAGGTMEEAMEQTGLTKSGLKALLKQKFGSMSWPIKEESL